MIRAVKYIYWYIAGVIAYIILKRQNEIPAGSRWQYYAWEFASEKSKPKVTKGEPDNDDQGSGE